MTVETCKLSSKQCKPCQGYVDALSTVDTMHMLHELMGDWHINDHSMLERTFKFKNFKDALAFTYRVGVTAEKEGHHPDIHLSWGKVVILLYTHKIKGLTESDFILAAKIDEID